MKKSSLVIVYHRQPFEEVVADGKVTFRENKSPNGIVPTLRSFFGRFDAGEGAWIAWKQAPAKGAPHFDRFVRIEDDHGSYTVSRLPLTAEQVKSFYHVTSKEALWPVLHSFPWLFQYDNVNWETFREVNRLFAEAAAEQAEDDALVWIHDYNLWLVPHYLRQRKPNARIAFFHHTPFPAPDVFNILPWREEILDSLLQCDLVGFHIPRYTKNFSDVARVLRGVEVTTTTTVEHGMSPVGLALSEPEVPIHIRRDNHTVGLDAFPVGTNPAYIQQLLSSPENRELQQSIANELQGQRLIIAVGRTDYTKGIRESLLAFDRLLSRRPELHGKLKLIVTSVKAATNMEVYKETQRDVEALVGRINGHYSTLSWTPVLLFTQAFPFERLLAYYRMADVCLTTPLRDGLNLVAKEFVAAKYGNPEQPGVLMLSEFAGCAVEFPQAVLTNPHSTRNMDIAMDRSLDMPREEAAGRMRAMYETVCRYDVSRWADHTFQRFEEIRQFREADTAPVA